MKSRVLQAVINWWSQAKKSQAANKEQVPGVAGEPGLRQTSCTP